MKKKLTIGLTGGYGTGKSTILREFKRLGAKTISADKLARDVVKAGKPAWKRIVASFGRDILGSANAINRRKLAALVFNDPRKRKLLEKITHPEIIALIIKRMKASKRHIVVEAPLLFEARITHLFDYIITVTSDFKAVSKRTGKPSAAIRARMRSQMPLSKKAALSDFIIDNSGSLGDTRRAVKTIWNNLTKLSNYV